jgi:hypothetical protein
MDLDAVRRLDETLRDDFARTQEMHSVRTSGYDEEHLDPDAHVASWTKAGVPLWEGRVELVARYSPELGVFRWWWTAQADGTAAPQSRLDRAYAEAQRTKVEALLSRQIVLDDAADAEMLARIACHLARAHGLLARAEGTQIAYYALFESAASLERAMTEPRVTPAPIVQHGGQQYAHSMPPPAVAPRRPSQPAPAVPREPALELVFPVAQAASASIKRALGGAFQNAIMVIVIDTSREKARFYVQLVAISPFGELEAPDTSRELMDAVTAMIVGDAKSGNARWHKLIVRFFPSGQSVGMGKIEVF